MYVRNKIRLMLIYKVIAFYLTKNSGLIVTLHDLLLNLIHYCYVCNGCLYSTFICLA